MFYRLREMLARFFYGRCGMDRLNIFLFVVYFILWFIGNILSLINGARGLYFALYIVNLGLLGIILFRALSKNLYKRQSENLKFDNWRIRAIAYLKLQKSKFRDRKSHVYKVCPNCKATIKLPRRKGKHTCCCPKCRVDFSVKI